MVDVPVLTDERTRKNYDRTWSLYPFEHPSAYWLRAGAWGMICTRCGAQEPACAEDFAPFVEQHLGCKLGHGLRVSTQREQARDLDTDPLFA